MVFDVDSITNGENAIYVLGQTTSIGRSSATAEDRMNTPTGVLLAMVEGTTITYICAPLYRLTAADASGGGYLHCTYDAVGNPVSLRSRGERPADGGAVVRGERLPFRERADRRRPARRVGVQPRSCAGLGAAAGGRFRFDDAGSELRTLWRAAVLGWCGYLHLPVYQ